MTLDITKYSLILASSPLTVSEDREVNDLLDFKIMCFRRTRTSRVYVSVHHNDASESFGTIMGEKCVHSRLRVNLDVTLFNFRVEYTTLPNDESKHGARILNDGAQNSDVESDDECNVDGVSKTVFSDNVDECNVDGHGKETDKQQSEDP
ncbi:hypothetical protein Tco_1232109, partial [Tanacetum coccineum]